MRIRWTLVIAMATVIVVGWHAAAHGASQARPGAPVLRIPPNDPLTRDHLRRVIAGSATARELVVRIQQLQDTVLILRAHPLLVRQEGLLGRGQFWVVGGHLYGLLEYQAEPRGNQQALRIIAHELAHALEVGLTPRAPDTSSLRPLVLERAREDGLPAITGVETDFARAVGYRVQLELLRRLVGPSSLSVVADATHLALGAMPPGALVNMRVPPEGRK